MANNGPTSPQRKGSSDCNVDVSLSEPNKVHRAVSFNDWAGWKENIEHVLESHKFHVIVVVFVILDVVIVTFQLLIDHDIIEVENEHKKEHIEHGLHATSIAILAMFVAELILKIVVFQAEFFKKYFEVFDGVVVIISFVLDVIPASETSAAAELVILARLWRVARIINGIILSITTAKEEEIGKLKKRNSRLEIENKELKTRLSELEGEETNDS